MNAAAAEALPFMGCIIVVGKDKMSEGDITFGVADIMITSMLPPWFDDSSSQSVTDQLQDLSHSSCDLASYFTL